MDIDDLWFVDQRHPMYHTVKLSKIGEMKVDLLKSVDYITTTMQVSRNNILLIIYCQFSINLFA